MSLKHLKKHIFQCESGQAMIEFIVVFPVFLLLVLGTLEFSLLSLAHQNVNYAAFNAARAKIVDRKPHFSAWVSLFMLSPHYISKLSPLEAFKLSYPEFKKFDISIDNKFKLFELVFDSPCLREIFGTGDKPLVDFGGEITLFGNTINNLEDFMNAMGNALIGAASDLLNSAVDEFNDGLCKEGYKLPPFIRKLLYAYSLTEIDVLELPDPDAPSVKVTVTYYYILKFPVIQSLFDFALRAVETKAERDQKIISGTGSKWKKADKFTEATGHRFIPISHSCTLGDEEKLRLK